MTSSMQTGELHAKALGVGLSAEIAGPAAVEVLQLVQGLAARLGWEHWTYQICMPLPDLPPTVLRFQSEEPGAPVVGDVGRFEREFSEACRHPDWQGAEPAAAQESNTAMQIEQDGAHVKAGWSVPVTDTCGVRGLFVCAGWSLPENAQPARRQRADAGWVGEFCHRAMADRLVALFAAQSVNAAA